MLSVVATTAMVGCSHQEAKPGQATVPPPVVSSDLPASLQSDGYRYVGLSYTQTRPMEMLQNGKALCTGTQTVTFSGLKGGNAAYTVTNTGELGTILGNLTLSVEPSGVYDVSSTVEAGTTHDLELPASLATGTKWTSKSTFFTKKGDKITNNDTCRVVGPQSVTTPAGVFNALLVQSDGTGEFNSEPYKEQSHMWYVKDRGLVKWEVIDTKLPSGPPMITVEEETK